MGGDVDDVVASGHYVHVAVLVDHARVARVDPSAVEALHVALVEALFVAKQGSQSCGREWDAHDDIPHRSSFDLVALVIDSPHVEARHGLTGRAGFYQQRLVLRFGRVFVAGSGGERDASDGGAGFGRPPVVDDLGAGRAVLL